LFLTSNYSDQNCLKPVIFEQLSMSVVTKRKWVRKEVMENFDLPASHQTIVQIIKNAGNNLHEVKTATGDVYLASLPMKFRKTCYIKRGDFVMTEPIEEGNKVKGEVVRILYEPHIKDIYINNMWPEEFNAPILKKYGIGKTKTENYFGVAYKQKEEDDEEEEKEKDRESGDEDEVPENPNQPLVNYGDYDSSESEDDDDIPENPNRPPPLYESDSSCSTSDEDDEEDEIIEEMQNVEI